MSDPRHEGLRIAGQVVGAHRAAHIAVHNPHTGALVGTVPKATLDEVRQAFAKTIVFCAHFSLRDSVSFFYSRKSVCSKKFSPFF